MKTRLILLTWLVANVLHAQVNLEVLFNSDVKNIIEDATKGFPITKGDLKDRQWGKSYYVPNNTIFSISNNANVTYSEPKYYPSSGSTDLQQYYFYQGFDSKNEQGIFVFENAERIFDEIATTLQLEKKVAKQKRKERSKNKSIFYSKGYQQVLQLYFDLENKSVSLYIFSDLKPNDLPNYLGCLILYNIQGTILASVANYYVYGSQLDSAEILYNKIMMGQDETYRRCYSKYEWMPNISDQQLDLKMKNLKIRPSYDCKINVEGQKIK